MKHTAVKALAVGLVASVLLSLGHFSALCGEIRGEVVRLHVLAHSDSEEDQALKLKVRDAVLMAAEGLLDGAENKEKALALATEQLPTLQAAAQRCVEENGYAYPVAVEL
ncbi:MAG: stage II sporulation protein R, partial [Clostridia bacterium]|nr:stage II sporulation protein R [Clostridia bacterium]